MAEIYGRRLKLGVVIPSTNTTVEPDCDDLRPTGVTTHSGRILIQERKISDAKAYDDHVRAMREGIDDAVQRVMTCGPGHLIMGVALEAFWGGVEGSNTLAAGLGERAGVGVTLGSSALDSALRKLNAKRIAILTPHMPAGDEQVRNWFAEAGYDIANLVGLQCASPRAIAEVDEEQMRKAIIQLDGDDVEAIVQVGTNLQFMRFAAAAETFLGKPVLAINAVMCWDALRRNGIEDRITGFGRILEDH